MRTGFTAQAPQKPRRAPGSGDPILGQRRYRVSSTTRWRMSQTWNATPSGSGFFGGMWSRPVTRWPAAWRCRTTWVPMKPEEPVTRTESGAMPRSTRQPAPDCAGPSDYGALKDTHRWAPLKPTRQGAFAPVTPRSQTGYKIPYQHGTLS